MISFQFDLSPSAVPMELDRWKIFSLLGTALRQKVRLACVFGKKYTVPCIILNKCSKYEFIYWYREVIFCCSFTLNIHRRWNNLVPGLKFMNTSWPCPKFHSYFETTLLELFFLRTGTHGNEALLVTVDDEVYALGSNAHGCLGLGNQQGTLFPQCVEQLCGKGIRSKFSLSSISDILGKYIFLVCLSSDSLYSTL